MVDPNRVAIYIRWSTDDQAQGTTLEVQKDACTNFIRSQGWQVQEDLIFIDDGYSGGSTKRPALSALRKAVGAGIVGCVVVFKLDRLSRSVIDTVNLVLREWDNKCHVKSAREAIDTASPQGKMFFYLLVSYAEWERSVIRDRTLSGKLKRIEQGNYAAGSSRAPYGFQRGDLPGTLLPVPNQQDTVRLIYSLYTSSDFTGVRRITRALNEMGLRSPTGKEWSPNTLTYILSNPVYVGKVVYGWKEPPTSKRRKWLQEPLAAGELSVPHVVSLEVWDRAQLKLVAASSEATRRRGKEKGLVNFRGLNSQHLFSGLARCKCGYPLSIIWQSKRKRYYRCARAQDARKDPCPYSSMSVPADVAESVFEQEFLAVLEDFHHAAPVLIEEQASNELVILEAEIAEAEKELATLRQEMETLNRLLRREVLDETEWQRQRQEVDAQRQRAIEQLQKLRSSRELALNHTISQEQVREAISLGQQWHALEVQQKKSIIRRLVSEITILRPRGSKEIDLTVHWRVGHGAGRGG